MLLSLAEDTPLTTTPRGHPRVILFSPDGKFLAVDGGSTVYVHDASTLELLVEWKAPRSREIIESCLSWSPDSRLLARTDGSTTVRIYEAATGREVMAIGKKPGSLTCVAFSPDGLTLATGTSHGPVRVWDVE
jgi:WD40 repeat protein